MVTSTNEKIAIMQAFDTGAEIEYRSVASSPASWRDVSNPLWNWSSYTYRVKQKPAVHRVRYRIAAIRDSKGGVGICPTTGDGDYVEKSSSFIQWLTPWTEIEVPDVAG